MRCETDKCVPCILSSVYFFLLLHAGQPKRHLLTTGWSVFVSAKRLVAGDSVLFIWYCLATFVESIANYSIYVLHLVWHFPPGFFLK